MPEERRAQVVGRRSWFGEAMGNGYRDSTAWNVAIAFVLAIYRATDSFRREERFGLVAQLRRAAVSIASNVAEGYGRNSTRELHQFVGMARGSLAEVDTQLEIARQLGYVQPQLEVELRKQATRLGQLLTGLRDWSAAAGQP